MFDATIFDWDGTLADSKQVVVASFQKVLRQLGCHVSDEFVALRIGIGAKNTFKEALATRNIPFDDRILEELVNEKIETQIELSEKVPLFEGSLKVLEALHSKMKMALASMNNRKVVDKLLDEKSLRGYFDIVLTADEVAKPKPNPEIFLECAKELDCHPEKCVVLEDSIFGVKAAKKAKMKCIAVLTGAYTREKLEAENPDLIVDSLKETEKILNFILNTER